MNGWLAKHRRFHMHFTPTGSSWINRWNAGSAFSPTSCSAAASTKALSTLENDVRGWIDRSLNDDPKPFTLDQNRRRDPRLTRPIYRTNFRWSHTSRLRIRGLTHQEASARSRSCF